MASASETCCGVCETQHVVTEATFWCPECDEGLCALCQKHHQASRATRNHEVTSVDNYKRIPSTIASINHFCSDHEKKYQLYCSEHEKLCCPLCITTNHKKCDLLAVDEIVKTSKTSALFEMMERSLKDMKSNMEKIVKDRKQNLEIIQQQRQKFKADIKTIRTKINKHLDKLEQEIQQDIQAAEQKIKSQIERLLSKLSDHGKTIDKIQNDISSTKSFATDIQTFFGGKMFEADIQKEEKFMQSLIEDGSIQQINIICRIDNKMSDIISMKKIGEISVKVDPPTITITTEREKQAQQMVPKISNTINDINLTLLKRFEISNRGGYSEISGCTIMPTREIVFVDKTNDRLTIHSENGPFVCEIPVSHSPVNITCIDENSVAVTHYQKPFHIEIINIAKRKIVKSIKTSYECYGITHQRGRLIYYETGRGIQTADIADESSTTTVVTIDGKQYWNYVTSSKDKIYHTCNESNTVTCYTVTGQKIWEFKDDSMLTSIRGVTVDNDSNVYLVSINNDNVVVLSPDGKNARRLLEGSGIKMPYGIHFDQVKNILLINTINGTVFLYNIQ
ncbi:E3 ubiquitin-protein ligase TRIM71-like [Mytilus edulis]|uniref:E3 ubiquitin-protein ligase TRIM71-like n=1 Tax=Mytilus edulis TaxID=6550 RepID=UPI0039EE004B